MAGSAGQSFGAFVPKASRCVSQEMLTTIWVVAFPVVASHCNRQATLHRILVAEENVIAGNVILYGATSGEVYIRA